VRVADGTWTALGSLNGGEVSHKMNREVVLMVDHPAVYDRHLEVFLHDWRVVARQILYNKPDDSIYCVICLAPESQ
jgi:phosphatidylserine/phosphatidylglycerophosphate/cardiolipin synthase-like enzyme